MDEKEFSEKEFRKKVGAVMRGDDTPIQLYLSFVDELIYTGKNGGKTKRGSLLEIIFGLEPELSEEDKMWAEILAFDTPSVSLETRTEERKRRGQLIKQLAEEASITSEAFEALRQKNKLECLEKGLI